MGTLIVNGRYEVLAELGRGGMGVVFRAKQRSLNRIVAIKMLSRELAGDPEFRHRFQQEAQVIARLQHENIITVYDIEADRGTFFIIMEYVEGVSLQELLRDEGRLPPEKAVRLVGQVARALGYAHNKGIIHRDIKPDNIMIVSNGGMKAMVMDFGIARVADSSLKTQTGISMGTPKYMSPEQARGQHVDARSDLYSLGVVLYATLTGELPFDGDSPFTIALKHMQDPPPAPSSKVSGIPPALENLVLRALSKKPSERFQSGEEFSAALEAALARPAAGPSLASGEALTTVGAITEDSPVHAVTATAPPADSNSPGAAPSDSTSLPDVADLQADFPQPTPSTRRMHAPRKYMVLAVIGFLALAVGVTAVIQYAGGDSPAPAPGGGNVIPASTATPAPGAPQTPAPATPSPPTFAEETPAIAPPRVVQAFRGRLGFGSEDHPATQAANALQAIRSAYDQALTSAAQEPLDEEFVQENAAQLARVLVTMAMLDQRDENATLAGAAIANIRRELAQFSTWIHERHAQEATRLFAAVPPYLTREARQFLDILQPPAARRTPGLERPARLNLPAAANRPSPSPGTPPERLPGQRQSVRPNRPGAARR